MSISTFIRRSSKNDYEVFWPSVLFSFVSLCSILSWKFTINQNRLQEKMLQRLAVHITDRIGLFSNYTIKSLPGLAPSRYTYGRRKLTWVATDLVWRKNAIFNPLNSSITCIWQVLLSCYTLLIAEKGRISKSTTGIHVW